MTTASETVSRLAKEDPERIAVRLDGQATTYARLDRDATRLANQLAAELPERSAVALQVNNSLAAIKVALGVRRAGMVLVPLDPTAPAARRLEMLVDSDARLLLVETSTDEEADTAPLPCPIRLVDDLLVGSATVRAVEASLDPNELQMLAYTSGSTGTPKAVMVAEIVTPFASVLEEVLPPSDAAWVAISTGSFGPAINVLSSGLALGRTVVPLEVRRIGFTTLADLIDQERAEALFMIPTVLRSWLACLDSGRRFPSLRLVAQFGEAMTGEDHNAMAGHLAGEAVMLNIYGTTEGGFPAFAARSAGEVAPPGRLPVGRAAPGVVLTIVDEAGAPLPPGEAGEIVVTAHSTALGYWRRPELTGTTFETLADGRRQVRTGDRGRLQADGTLLHLGRHDGVVKVSGNRVDLGDVEHALRSLDAVDDAVVIAHVDDQGVTTLRGYIVVSTETAATHPVVLRAELARRLPAWMVPVSMSVLPVLPRLANGKVDRRNLPLPEIHVHGDDDSQDLSALEAELLGVWREVLGRPDLGVDDDFFALGGDSIKAAAVMAQLDARHGVVRPLSLLFDAPTVSTLAVVLDADLQRHVLVPVKPAGEGKPIIVVHGGRGDAFFAWGLARHLDPDWPVYALQPSSEDGDELRDRSIEDLATRYLNAVRHVQPVGPYRLFGYSAGGLIAFEMARQLEEAGRPVQVVVLGDSPAPGTLVRPEPIPPAARRSARIEEVRAAGPRDAALLAVRLARSQVRYQVRVLRRRRAHAKARPVPVNPETPEQRSVRMVRSVGRLAAGYQPTVRITAPLVLARSNHPGPPDLGWSKLTDNLRIEAVGGTHLTMVREPHVQELASVITKACRLQSPVALVGAPPSGDGAQRLEDDHQVQGQ